MRKLLERLRGMKTFNADQYWERRYKEGGNSGRGSYKELATYKANYINQVIYQLRLMSGVELGCGDGHQLQMYRFETYHGVDVAPSAVERCRRMYNDDASKSFSIYQKGHVADFEADCALSIDVLYHIIDKRDFEQHLNDLFSLARKAVIIYAWDCNHSSEIAHVKPRRFTGYIANHFPKWKLTDAPENPYHAMKVGRENGSFASFFLYEKA